jgi:hypothetical protein
LDLGGSPLTLPSGADGTEGPPSPQSSTSTGTTSDFHSDYTRIRDKLGADGQDLDLVDRLERWNAVDELSTTLLVEDAEETWQALVVHDK